MFLFCIVYTLVCIGLHGDSFLQSILGSVSLMDLILSWICICVCKFVFGRISLIFFASWICVLREFVLGNSCDIAEELHIP